TGDRSHPHAHPSRLDPGDEHLRQPRTLDRRGDFRRYGRFDPTMGFLGRPPHRSGSGRVDLEKPLWRQRLGSTEPSSRSEECRNDRQNTIATDSDGILLFTRQASKSVSLVSEPARRAISVSTAIVVRYTP